MDKQEAIEEMAKSIKDNCLISHGAYYDRTAEGYISEIQYKQTARNFIEAGYGNISQALAEFVEKLKKKATWHDTETCDDDYYNLCVGLRDIDKTLEEFKNGYKI